MLDGDAFVCWAGVGAGSKHMLVQAITFESNKAWLLPTTAWLSTIRLQCRADSERSRADGPTLRENLCQSGMHMCAVRCRESADVNIYTHSLIIMVQH